MQDRLPDGWTVWNESPDGRAIVVFRPDVFDARELPAACLPTIYVTDGSPRPRPGAGSASTGRWQSVFFLEPEIELDRTEHGSRSAAIDGAIETARAFVDGELEYRDAYQVPREAYFEILDELIDR